MRKNIKAVAKRAEVDIALMATIAVLGLLPVALGTSLAVAQLLHFAR